MKARICASLGFCIITTPAAADPSFSVDGWISTIIAAGSQPFRDDRVAAGLRGSLAAEGSDGPFKGRVAIQSTTNSELGNRTGASFVRESWVRYSGDSDDLTVGRQLLPQGRSDRIYPQDQFAPRDLSQLALTDAEQRIGLPAVRLDHYLNDALTLTAAYILQDRGDLLPKYIQDVLPPGRSLAEAPVQAGFLRIEWRPGPWELGVDAGTGANPLPAIELVNGVASSTNPAETRFAFDGTYSNAAGGILRWDVVRSLTQTDNLPGVASRGWFASLGWDHGLWSDATGSLQVINRYVDLPENTAQTPQTAAIAAENRFLLQTFRKEQVWGTAHVLQQIGDDKDAEGGILAGEQEQYGAFARFGWRFTDHWRADLYASAFGGKPDTLAGAIQPARRIFLEIRYRI
jgi:hypothetical protein